MDPSWYTSIAGIAGATVVIVQGLKAWLSGSYAPAAKIPTALYVVLVAGLGTWFAHDVLGTLDGDLSRLVTDAITAALIASGGFEMARSATKQIGTAGLALLLVVGLAWTSAACASAAPKERVVEAYQASHAAIRTFRQVERVIYESQAVPTLTPERHLAILEAISSTLAAQDKAGAALLVWRAGQPIPTEVTAWLAEVERVIGAAKQLDSGGHLPTQLAETLVSWAKAIVELAQELKMPPPTGVAAVADQGGL